jgi:DNA polymerase-1
MNPKTIRTKRWAFCEDFNPLSSHQVLDYCRGRKYKIPLDRKTRRPTTAKDGLATLIKRYPQDRVLWSVLEARALSKAIGYLDDSRLGADGKFHPTYTFAPDTGRLASINPNFQNQPNHGVADELATAIRRTVVPSPGMALVELDWKAIEAVLTGYFAGDQGFIRLSLEDSHSFLGWHILHHKRTDFPSPPSPTDPDLGKRLALFKRDHPMDRELAKRVNHATSYGMGPRHMSNLLKISLTQAQEILRIKDAASPKVAAWKNTIRRQAHSQGFLENPFKYRRYFTHVFSKDHRTGEWKLGDEANKCLAFLPQSTAAGMLRETLLLVSEVQRVLHPSFGMLVPIHDAILLEVREGMREEVTAKVKEIMQRPWVELGGLSIPVDVKWGSSWGDMHR